MRLPFGITLTRDAGNSQHAPASAAPASTAIANATTTSNGTVVQSSDLEGMREVFGIDAAIGGKIVTPDNAMRVATCYACTRLIAGGVAMMPLKFYGASVNGQAEPRPDHPLRWLFNESADGMFTAASWKELMLSSMLLWGDGFTAILRDRNGGIIGLMPFMPWQVQPLYNFRLGVVYYACFDRQGHTFAVAAEDMLHFPSFGFNGLRSMSVVQWAARQAIGIALAADDFSGSFYANGAKPPYALKHPADLTKDQIDKMRDQWQERYGGSGNAHRPLILTNGLDVKELAVSAEDAQLLEARKFQVIDIARAFGVPPSLIGETEKVSSWGSGVEHMTLAFITFTIGPHTTRIEHEINRKVFKTNTGSCRFDVRALLRLDSAARAKYYREAIGGSQGPGWMTANEVRREDELPPIAGGDERYTPTKTTAPADGAQPKGNTQ